MSGFGAFLVKELREITKTWRIWVLPGMILFFAVTSPIMALIAPQLVSSFAGSQPGVVIKIPDPTYADAYSQFLKNLNQIVLIGIVIAMAGCVSGERKAGTALLVLTKPLSRAGFVMAKIVSQTALVVAATIVGTIICALMTVALFGTCPITPLVKAVSLWLACAILFIVLMTFLSVAFMSRGGACGVGFGLYALFPLLSMWSPAAKYSPAGLVAAASRSLSPQQPEVLWPLVTATILATALTTVAVLAFQRKEL